jgi:hypothetical protein
MNLYKLLLIDNRVSDIETVKNSINNTSVKYITIDFETDTLNSIQYKVNNLDITEFSSVGIFQENYDTEIYQFVKSFNESVLTNIELTDPELSTWSQFIDLSQYFKTSLSTAIPLSLFLGSI